MQNANRRLLTLLAGSVLALLLAVQCSICAAAETEQPVQEETVQVPLSKLQELNDLMNSQSEKINLLEQQLNAPTKELKEQQKLISELRSSLQEAKNSLNKSELIIAEQNKSLQSLSVALKQDVKRTKRIERQRTLWQVVAFGTATVLLKEKTK